uniref:Uncharacterized protein n=1 Tax=Oryza barthii TaxID=65489 RepID=A0A0D3HH87_9ORYZ
MATPRAPRWTLMMPSTAEDTSIALPSTPLSPTAVASPSPPPDANDAMVESASSTPFPSDRSVMPAKAEQPREALEAGAEVHRRRVAEQVEQHDEPRRHHAVAKNLPLLTEHAVEQVQVVDVATRESLAIKAILLGDVLAPLLIALNLEYAAAIATPPDPALLGRRYHLRQRAAARRDDEEEGEEEQGGHVDAGTDQHPRRRLVRRTDADPISPSAGLAIIDSSTSGTASAPAGRRHTAAHALPPAQGEEGERKREKGEREED